MVDIGKKIREGRDEAILSYRLAKLQEINPLRVEFDDIHVISYGTPKGNFNKFGSNAVLFDDNEEVLNDWNGIPAHVIEPPKILETLKEYLT